MQKNLTRTELYERVWAEPMTKVAEECGLSDRGLAKLCGRHGIPVPPRGYWAKKNAGYRVRQPALRKAADGQSEQVTIQSHKPPEEVREVMATARRKVRTATVMPLAVGEPHPAIRATAKALRRAKPLSDGSVCAEGGGHCGVRVGTAGIERTIGILDALARALEAQGLELEPAGSHMRVAIGPDELTFRLIERTEAQKHVPTQEELAREEKRQAKRDRDIQRGIYSFDNEKAYPEYDIIRTGELGIHIKDDYVTNARRSWKDGRTRKVEDLLEDITVGIVAYLAGLRAKREEHERWHREWEEKQRRRELMEEYRAREGKRREFVLGTAAKMTEIATFAALLGRMQAQVPAGETDEFSRMVQWMETRIAMLERELERDRITPALREKRLFPVSSRCSPREAHKDADGADIEAKFRVIAL